MKNIPIGLGLWLCFLVASSAGAQEAPAQDVASPQPSDSGGEALPDMSMGGDLGDMGGDGGAEQKELGFSVNGLIKMQAGVFVPLASNGFKEDINVAYDHETLDRNRCDPVMFPDKSCFPRNHGMEAGSLSMFRTLFQLEGDWVPVSKVAVHGILRGVRSLMTDADGWAQMPVPSHATTGAERRAESRQWVLDNYYNKFEIRELYVDVFPTDRLSLRIGRQQVTWGETGQFRLLDVINPVDSTFHFAPIEAYEDTRVPLWLVKGMIDFPNDQSLELVWVPGIDRPKDMVNTPLTFVGAWGVPYSNTPSPFLIDKKEFLYPKNALGDAMRAGLRWKGALGTSMTYSLVYYYTHQISPPIPLYFDMIQLADGSFDSTHLETLYLGYPRQHIAGFSFDFTLENPIGAVVRVETSVEPDRAFPVRSDTSLFKKQDPKIEARSHFLYQRKPAVSYAVVAMRPSMIRWLNPKGNVLLVLQWMQSLVFGIDNDEKEELVEIPGFNKFYAKKNDMRVIGAMSTTYFNGFFTPKVIGAYIVPDSAFVSADFAFRFGDVWRMNVTVTDFFGGDPYKDLGLFRDRDELNVSLTAQF